jgi:hypothetical protein
LTQSKRHDRDLKFIYNRDDHDNRDQNVNHHRDQNINHRHALNINHHRHDRDRVAWAQTNPFFGS